MLPGDDLKYNLLAMFQCHKGVTGEVDSSSFEMPSPETAIAWHDNEARQAGSSHHCGPHNLLDPDSNSAMQRVDVIRHNCHTGTTRKILNSNSLGR